jgi:hypothetical protein
VPFLSSAAATRVFPRGSRLLCRIFLVAIFVVLTHQFEWRWLRVLTTEAVVLISKPLGINTELVLFDTIRVHGELFRIVTSCTFVDVFMGAIPLVWNLKKSVSRNLLVLVVLAVGFFAFNIIRLGIAQLLHARGAPWMLADGIIGGGAYFIVWLFIVSRFSENWSEAA